MTDRELLADLSHLDTLALTLYGEARSERVEGRVAVGCVVRNRLETKRYGASFKAVCLMPWQFSCWLQHDDAHARNFAQLIVAARALRNGQPGPVLRECVWIAGGVIEGALQDITRKSCHYITRALWESKPPKWTHGLTPAIGIGSHVYFNDVS